MWDVKISLFIHVFSIATWFGATTLMAMYLRNATRTNDNTVMANSLATAHRWNVTMMIPTSVLAFITGLYMLIQFQGDKPLWLLVKERLGSLFIIAFILVIALYGKKLLKAAKESASSSTTASFLKKYIMVLNLSVLIMVVLIFFVTTKI
jgi:putative copper export protein